MKSSSALGSVLKLLKSSQCSVKPPRSQRGRRRPMGDATWQRAPAAGALGLNVRTHQDSGRACARTQPRTRTCTRAHAHARTSGVTGCANLQCCPCVDFRCYDMGLMPQLRQLSWQNMPPYVESPTKDLYFGQGLVDLRSSSISAAALLGLRLVQLTELTLLCSILQSGNILRLFCSCSQDPVHK